MIGRSRYTSPSWLAPPSSSTRTRIPIDRARDARWSRPFSGVDGVEVRSPLRPLSGLLDRRGSRAAARWSRPASWSGSARFYWYSVPALLQPVVREGAGARLGLRAGGTALRAKRCLWVTTTGAAPDGYRRGGMHGYPFESFVPAGRADGRVLRDAAGEPPLVVHGAHRTSSDEPLRDAGREYRRAPRGAPVRTATRRRRRRP